MPNKKSQPDPSHLQRASTDKLRKVFEKYATHRKNGKYFMTNEDFVTKFLGLLKDVALNDDKSVRLLASIADTNNDGLISFSEFQAFEALLCAPDALYRTTFQLFDRQGNGKVSYADFADVVQKTELHSKIPFSLDSPFVHRYFGTKKQRLINYEEFTQLLHDFHEEYAMEAFHSKDPTGSGYISSSDFKQIMVNVMRHLLTADVKDNLIATTEGQTISFPYFMAFTSLLNNMELIKLIYLNTTHGNRIEPITKDDLLYAAQTKSQITPLQIDILYKLAGVLYQSRWITFSDLNNIAPQHYTGHITTRLVQNKADTDSAVTRSAYIQMLESVYRFSLGAISGGFGAFCVYPIDLVKTRMQNQRKIGGVLYRHALDCAVKVVQREGFFGLYRGVLPQVMGVTPEKATKLTVNDFIRGKFTDKQGVIPLWAEILGGGCAGASQVVITNPLEIVKIRLQTAGEAGIKRRATVVIRELGFFGLYRGVRACLMRDIPFSAIYFPTYAHTKATFANKEGYNHPLTLLAAGAMAAIPAASLVTPADVIKTRLQVIPRPGQTTYTGIVDAATKVFRQEGPGAFWKGVIPRVCRSSPQLGITLFTYEVLQRLFYVDFGGSRPSGSEKQKPKPVDTSYNVSINTDHIGGYRAAVPVLSGIEWRFGLFLPRYGYSQTETSTGSSNVKKG